MSGQTNETGIYSPHFWLLCTSSLLFFASFNMIIPELPAYLTSLGGEAYKGLIISLFAITAMLSRPFSGRLADKLGRVPVIMVGSIVCFISSLLYPLLSSVSGFMLLRLIHGFSTGFTPTGQMSYLSDIIPANRRGEAMGLLGTAGTVGMAVGPAIGGAIANNFSFNFLFYCSSFFALTSIIILTGLKETLASRSRFNAGMLAIGWKDIFEWRVWVPCVIIFLAAYAYGTVLTVIPDFGEHVGIRNKGLLFTFFTVSSLGIRLLAGRVSDRFGRRNVILVSMTVIASAMVVIALSDRSALLMLGMSLYGIGHGMTAPTVLAWATDLSLPELKGRGLATIYIFLELGIGIGAFLSGLVFHNDPANFFLTFFICATATAIGFLFLLYRKV